MCFTFLHFENLCPLFVPLLVAVVCTRPDPVRNRVALLNFSTPRVSVRVHNRRIITSSSSGGGCTILVVIVAFSVVEMVFPPPAVKFPQSFREFLESDIQF